MNRAAACVTLQSVEHSPLGVAVLRSAVALVTAVAVAALVGLAIDPPGTPAAMLVALAIAPGVLAWVAVDACGRPRAARIGYLVWFASVFAYVLDWHLTTGEARTREIATLLMLLWTSVGVATSVALQGSHRLVIATRRSLSPAVGSSR